MISAKHRRRQDGYPKVSNYPNTSTYPKMGSYPKVSSLAVLACLFLLLSGCSTINDYKKVNQPEPQINQSNETVAPPPPTFAVDLSATNVFLFKSSGSCAFVVTPGNTTMLIDCGDSNYLDTIQKVKSLGYNSVDIIIASHGKSNAVGNLDKLALKFRPKIIYDNGIKSDVARYRTLNISEIMTVKSVLSDGDITLEPSYAEGFLGKLEQNTLVFSIGNDVTLLNDCYGDCQDKVSSKEVRVLELANGGSCPTTSLDFILKANPQAVITNGDVVCGDIRDDLTAIDVPMYNRQTNDIQIIFGDELKVVTR